MHGNDGVHTAIDKLRWTEPAACEDAWRETPSSPGVYRWFLSGELPGGFDWPHTWTPIVNGDLIYVGRATSLRTRAKHHRLGTAKSTLRRALASLMGLQAEWRGASAHPGLITSDEADLTHWMSNNLFMSFALVESLADLTWIEESLRSVLKAPLNRDKLTPEQLHTSAMTAVMQSLALGGKGLL
ncbi:MAG: hypothetical protein JWN34_780 [Bryobacterales bacterium]|nr:hypothetical protein [Bryobacterales bacterium]